MALLLACGCSQPAPPLSQHDSSTPVTLAEPSGSIPASVPPSVTSPDLAALEARLDDVTEAVSKSPQRSGYGVKLPARFEIDAESPLSPRQVWMSVNVYWCDDGCVDGPAETPVTDDDLKLLLPFAMTLTTLDLRRTEITDAGLQTLAALTSLESLQLAGCKFNGSGLAHLAALTHLQHLDLSDTQIESERLQALAALPSLKTVTLSNVTITDDVLATLGQLHQLQSLNLAKSPISDEGLAGISHLQFLESLDLTGTETSDKGLVHLSGLTNLRKLRLSQTKIQGAGLPHLAKLVLLTELELADTQVDDAGLSHLSGLSELQMLDLSRTLVRGGGLTHLRECLQLHSAKLPPVDVSAIPAINTVKSWHSLNLGLSPDDGLLISEAMPPIAISDMPELKTLSIRSHRPMSGVMVKNCEALESFALQHDSNFHPGATLRCENLPTLQHLSLNGAFRELSDRGVFSQVTRFHLDGALTSDVVRAISSFKSLVSMHLRITGVTGNQVSMEEFPELTEMRSVDVQLKSSDAGWLVRLIGRMPALERLDLRGHSLSGEQLAPLSNCQMMKHISIHGVDDPGEPLVFLEAMPDIDQCLILGCPQIGRIRLTKKTGLRRFYFKYGQLDELEIDGAPNLSEVNLAHRVHGDSDDDARLPELGIGRLIVHDVPRLLYLRAIAKESAIHFTEISLTDLPQLRSLTLYAPPPEKQPIRCRVKTAGDFPKLVQRRLFHVSIDQESLARLNDSPILGSGQLVDVQVDAPTE